MTDNNNIFNDPDIRKDGLGKTDTTLKLDNANDSMDMDIQRPVNSSTNDVLGDSINTRSSGYDVDNVADTSNLGQPNNLEQFTLPDYDSFILGDYDISGFSIPSLDSAPPALLLEFMEYWNSGFVSLDNMRQRGFMGSNQELMDKFWNWFYLYKNPDVISNANDNSHGSNLNGVGSTKSLEELEADLQRYQASLEMALSNPDTNMTSLASSLARFFEAYGQYMQQSGVFDMSKADSWLASNTLYNDCVELINNRLQQTYARENWVYQQEYNLPANAISRLIEAGINPAFYFSSMDKSSAGSIDTPALQSPQQTTPISGEVPWMGQLNGALGVVSTLGQIGGLFNEGISAISGSTLNMSTALLNQFMTENGQAMQPYQIANLESVTAMNNALSKTEDETRSGKVATNWARVLEVENNAWYQKKQIKMYKKQLKNTLKIAKMTNDTNLSIADLNAETQRYLGRIQKEMNLQRIAADSYLQILPYMEDYNTDEEYWDVESGESFTREDMLNSTFKVQSKLGTSVDVAFVGDAHAEGQISNEDFEGWKENTTKTIGGRKYTKRQVSRRVFNPARFNQALEFVDKAFKDLKNGKITSEQFHYAKASAYRIIQEEQDNINKYSIDKGLKQMLNSALPSEKYMR